VIGLQRFKTNVGAAKTNGRVVKNCFAKPIF